MLSSGTTRGKQMSTENVEVIRRFEDAFASGDIEGVLASLTDDVVVHECDSVPYPGDHRGKEAFLELLETFVATWELEGGLVVDEILPAGVEKVLVLSRADVVAKATGRPLELRIAEVYTVRAGAITEIVVHYWDTHAMVEATTVV
jgi:ketosteroid isomerase-like protein